ncbi:MAG: 30S ribosomal protein S17 [Actinobacteria bacterium]|nr:30S ribosomal protein S17 [Actinomycetota bacterium]
MAPETDNVTNDATGDDSSTETAAAPTSTPTTPTAAAAAPSADEDSRSARKLREGMVVSDKMDKTAVVAVVERVRHPKYGKFMMRTKKLYAHDETNDANVGDKVRVMETRPLSKNKRWRVVEILERAK